MGLLPSNNVEVAGSARYRGSELVGAKANVLRSLWGSELSMVFQDPMTSLNPVMRIGKQNNDVLRHPLDMSQDEDDDMVVSRYRPVKTPEPETLVERKSVG